MKFVSCFPRRKTNFLRTNDSGYGGGFTLIELLATIAICAILGSLLIAGVQRARDRADSTVCATHLRNLGVAINLYQADNNGRYPGPIWYGVRHEVWKVGEEYAPLTLFLAPYLGLPDRTGMVGTTRYKVDSAICPAWLRENQNPDLAHYGRHTDASLSPFGGRNETDGSVYEPSTVYRAPGQFNMNLSEIMALRDAQPSSPRTRHHGGQNILFLDGHVEWLSGRSEPPKKIN